MPSGSDLHTLTAVLTHLTGLTKLCMHSRYGHRSMQDDTSRPICPGSLSDAVACITGLQHLEINVPVDAAAKRAPLFSCLRKLTKLVLGLNCTATSTSAMRTLHGDALLGASHLQSLQWLEVHIERDRSWDHSCVGKSFIAALPHLKQLRCLLLGPAMWAASPYQHLLPHLAHTLTRLHFRTFEYIPKRSAVCSEVHCYGDFVEPLSTVGVLTSLRHLAVFCSGCLLDRLGSSLLHLTTLTRLQVRSWNDDNHNFCKRVMQSAELRSFEQFSSGLSHLASLQHLSLLFPCCRQQSICSLSGALRHLESLRSLELPLMPLDSVALKPVLAAVRCMPWLQRLNLSGETTEQVTSFSDLDDRIVELIAYELRENRNIREFEVYVRGEPVYGVAQQLRACWAEEEDPMRFRQLPV